MDFTTGADLLSLCEENGWTIAQVMLQRETEQTGVSREAVRSRLDGVYGVMWRAVRTTTVRTFEYSNVIFLTFLRILFLTDCIR